MGVRQENRKNQSEFMKNTAPDFVWFHDSTALLSVYKINTMKVAIYLHDAKYLKVFDFVH